MANSKKNSVTSGNIYIDRVDADSNKSILTGLGLKSQKESNAAFHLVPFLIKVLGIEKSELTDAISKSIVDLDYLAQKIDAKIDSSSISKGLNYAKFNNLELNIVECFSHLTGSPKLENLITNTLQCVNTSFKFNTVERHKIYNLKNTEFNGCTTFYLFPLVDYLFSQSKFQISNKRLFFLVANYIQILDDYIDVLDDRDLQIQTPITVRLNEIESSNGSYSKSESPFQTLTNEVFETLVAFLNEIQVEAKKINKHLSMDVFSEWRIFHSEFQKLKLPNEMSEIEIRKYQKEVLKRMPQIICYTG